MAIFTDIHTHNAAAGGVRIASHRLGIGEPVPAPPYSEGIHPWDVGAVEDTEALLARLAADDIAAVGETGLDRSYPDMERQQSVFRRQLEIAARRRLPVIIHCVKAFGEAMKILEGYALPAVIFHGYIGSLQQTETLIESGYYISAGKVSLESPKTVLSLRAAPPGRLFFETDDTGLPIEEIYRRASAALGISIEGLAVAAYENYKRVFTK